MKVLGRHEKYRKLQEADIPLLKQQHLHNRQSIWYPKYHIAPLVGNVSSVASVVYYASNWHIFYENYPFEASEGASLWYHVTSSDLTTFKNEGIAVKPDTWFDNAACHKGSCIAEDDLLYIAYQGENRDDAWVAHPYHMVAAMNEDNNFIKHDAPIITQDAQYEPIMSAPLLFKREEDNMYYILLGVRTKDGFGKLVLYRSQEVYQGWKKLGYINIKEYPTLLAGVTSVELRKIDGYDVLFLRLKGEEEKEYYLIGSLDLYHMEFITHTQLQEVDEGWDFAYSATAKNGEDSVLLGVLKNREMINGEEGWNNFLSLPRKISVANNRLLQQPYRSNTIKERRLFYAKEGNIVEDRLHALMPRSCVMEIDNPHDRAFLFNLFCWGRDRGFEFSYDPKKQTFSVDRSFLRYAPRLNNKKTVHTISSVRKAEVFVDCGSVEIFLNGGEQALSARICPAKDEAMIRMVGKDIDVSIFQTNQTNDSTFKF